MKVIKVVDLETGGLSPGSHPILEIAIVSLDENRKREIEYESMVNSGSGISIWTLKRYWPIVHGYIKPNEVVNAQKEWHVAGVVLPLLKDQRWTAFNAFFEWGFLQQDPWNIDTRPAFDLMKIMTDICKIPRYNNYGSNEYKWPNLSEAYTFIEGKDQSGDHRALNDCLKSIEILEWLLDKEYVSF